MEKDGFAVEIPMYIDSGADVSMIPFRFSRALGFKQEKEYTIQEIKGVSGAGVPYILKEVALVLNGKRLKVKMAWALVEEVPMLIGRMDIFYCIGIRDIHQDKFLKFLCNKKDKIHLSAVALAQAGIPEVT